MSEHDRCVRSYISGGTCANILGFLHRHIDHISTVQGWLPARKQVIEADANCDAAVEARYAQRGLDDFASMRIGAVGAGQNHQLRSTDCRHPLELCVDLRTQEAECKRAI